MRRLAVGGMAEIYLARITGAAGFEKLVVLKRILPNVAEDPTFVQMFIDEARLAATLRHPNIADVYDVGEADGTFFFTMEYVYGQDVRSIRHDAKKRNEQIPLAIALSIVHGTASALEHAHEKLGADGKPLNLVHRDVSASNVMVSYDGAVKLLDFGIARAASSTHKTQTGTLKGKVPYMSPEQCKGLPLDRRSDLFSLGTVFYELTVGRRPFRGDSDFAIMDQIVYKGAQRPSELVKGYPEDLEAIVMRLLERAPSKRYTTGEELLHDLDAFISKHNLWVSPRAIGKYMRGLFADKIEAWEQAEQEGVPFAQHVAQTITSQSMRSELVTPPSALMKLPPGSKSQEMMVAEVQEPIGKRPSAETAAQQRTSAEIAAQDRSASQRLSQPMAVFPPIAPVKNSQVMPVPIAPSSQVMAVPIAPSSQVMAPSSQVMDVPVYPALKSSRSGTTIVLAFAGALVLGAGGVIGYMMSRGDKPGVEQKAVEEPAKQMNVSTEPAAIVEPAKPEPTKPEPVNAEPANAEPAKQEPSPPAAAAPAAAAQPPTVEPTVPVDMKPEPEPKPAAAKPTATKPTTKPAPKKPAVKPKKPKQPSEESTWDPNSPFLPQ